MSSGLLFDLVATALALFGVITCTRFALNRRRERLNIEERHELTARRIAMSAIEQDCKAYRTEGNAALADLVLASIKKFKEHK